MYRSASCAAACQRSSTKPSYARVLNTTILAESTGVSAATTTSHCATSGLLRVSRRERAHDFDRMSQRRLEAFEVHSFACPVQDLETELSHETIVNGRS